MNNPDHISESLETIFWVKILIFFNADPGSWMKNSDPRWKKFGSVIRDKHPGSATLMGTGQKMSGVGKKREPQNKSTEEPTNKNQSEKKTRRRRPNLRERQHGKPERPHSRCLLPRKRHRKPPLRRPALGGQRAGVPARPLLPTHHSCSSESRFFRA